MFFLLIKDAIQEFKVECQLKRFSTRSIKGYVNNNLLMANYLENEFDITQIEEVKTAHIKSYMQYLIATNHKATYINGILKCIRAFFKYCMQEDILSVNPALRVSWEKEPKTLIKTFTDEEVKRMLSVYDYSDYLSARNRLILTLAFDTGMRNTEICSILNNDISDTYLLVHGKGDKERNVPISPLLRKTMLRYERIKVIYFKNKILKYDNYLLSRTAQPLTKEALEWIFKNAGERAKVRSELRCSPHTARHYYAQANLRNGLDIYSLSRLMGHVNTNITKTYLQSLKDQEIVELAMRSSPLMNLK